MAKKIKLQIKSSENNQVLNQLFFKNPSDFEPRYFKDVVFCTNNFLQIVRFWRFTFTACENLSQQIYQSPAFGTTSLQRVQFSIVGVKCVRLRANFNKTRQVFIRDFYSVSDSEITFFEPTQFLNRKNYKASDLRKTLILGEQKSLEIRFHIVNFWCQFTSWKRVSWHFRDFLKIMIQWKAFRFFFGEGKQISNQNF